MNIYIWKRMKFLITSEALECSDKPGEKTHTDDAGSPKHHRNQHLENASQTTWVEKNVFPVGVRWKTPSILNHMIRYAVGSQVSRPSSPHRMGVEPTRIESLQFQACFEYHRVRVTIHRLTRFFEEQYVRWSRPNEQVIHQVLDWADINAYSKCGDSIH